MLDENSADMTPEARTERLYWFLRNMGLVVEPEMKDGRWCALRVAVELPALAAQVSSEASIDVPMKCPKIRENIFASECNRDDVIDFPSKN